MGRLVPRRGPFALQGVQHGGALSADVPAGADVQVQVKVETASQDPRSQVAGALGLGDGPAHDVRRARVLGPDEQIDGTGLDGV